MNLIREREKLTMEVQLIRATTKDAEHIWKMQVESFSALLDKYEDFETNPASEPVDRVIERLEQSSTYYYYIKVSEDIVGAIRVINDLNKSQKWISPLFVLPKFQNQGIAQKAIAKAEELHGAANWKLATILQEEGNCHLYERMGYYKTGKTKVINERMTLVYYQKD